MGPLATKLSGVPVSQNYARSLDRRIRLSPDRPLQFKGLGGSRIGALVKAACQMIAAGAPACSPHEVHRLDKADTRQGSASLRSTARMGVPYPMLLYERFLGRPFASHRDSVS